jgi:hypothetical protein
MVHWKSLTVFHDHIIHKDIKIPLTWSQTTAGPKRVT